MRQRQEERYNQCREQLEVGRGETQLQHQGDNGEIEDRAEDDADQLEGKLRKELCRRSLRS